MKILVWKKLFKSFVLSPIDFLCTSVHCTLLFAPLVCNVDRFSCILKGFPKVKLINWVIKSYNEVMKMMIDEFMIFLNKWSKSKFTILTSIWGRHFHDGMELGWHFHDFLLPHFQQFKHINAPKAPTLI